jgi:RecA-family ATPase
MITTENDAVIITADELMKTEIDSLEAIVENLLYPGLTIIAGDPKIGKSWFALDLVIKILNEQNFLTFKTNKCDCLYYALEDSFDRLQKRLKQLIDDEELSLEGLHLANNSRTLEDGFLSDLEEVLEKNSKIRLVIIDTLQLIRGRSKNSYAGDYEQISELKKFADKHKICILVIHHLKRTKERNKFNRILGGNGINGAVDTMIILEKLENSTSKALLSVSGRDVESNEKMLEFDKKACRWNVLENNINSNEVIRKIAYTNDPVAVTIKQILEENAEGIRLTVTDLIREIIERTGNHPEQPNAQALGRYIRDDLQFKLLEYDNIHYSPPPANGGASGRRMFFYKKQEIENAVTQEQIEDLDSKEESIEKEHNTNE